MSLYNLRAGRSKFKPKKLLSTSILLISLLAGILLSFFTPSAPKAEAQWCFEAGQVTSTTYQKDGCTDVDIKIELKSGECYEKYVSSEKNIYGWNATSYKKVPCPVPSSYTKDRNAVCREGGKIVDCPDASNIKKGQCYNIETTGSRQQRQQTAKQTACNTDFYPGYKIAAKPPGGQGAAPRCFENSVELPNCNGISGATGEDECYQVEVDRNSGAKRGVRSGCDEAEIAAATAAENQPSDEESVTCESLGGALGWIMCPVVLALDGSLNWLDTQIQALLEIDEDKYTNSELQTAWKTFRNIAYVILIPVMLVMVIGTALGFEVFSAYTVKKALPRMVIAIIFITLSWYITGFLIGFSNVVGGGILGIMTYPFGMQGGMNLASLFSSDPGGSSAVSAGIQWAGASAALIGIGALASFSGGLGIIMLYLGSAVLFIFTAFIVLVIRQMFIIALILLAPLAILAWIFPGNDKMWKLWWGTFSKLLLMFPLIMVIIASGRIFAKLIDITGGGGVTGVINPLLKLTAYVLPFLLIPLTFKFAGGIFANLAGMINDREKGLFDRMKKSRADKYEDLNNRRKSGNLYKKAPEGSRRSMINNKAERLSHIGKAGFSLDRSVRKARIDSALATNNLSDAHREMKENQELASLLGNEDYTEAGRSGHGYVKDDKGNYVLDSKGKKIRRDGSENAVRAYLQSRGYKEEDVQSVMHARAGMSQDVFNVAAVLSIPGTGTGFKGGAGEMDRAINETAGDNRRLATTMLAEMRGTAERAGRSDLKGGGFNKRRIAMEEQYKQEVALETQYSVDSVEYDQQLVDIQSKTTSNVDDMTIYSTDSRGIAGMKPGQIRDRIVPKMMADLMKAKRDGNETQVEMELAKIASVYDQAQYSSPEVQDAIAGMMGAGFTVRQGVTDANGNIVGEGPEITMTIREAVEEARNKSTFLDRRRELGAGRRLSEADLAAMTTEERAEHERQAREAEARAREEGQQ